MWQFTKMLPKSICNILRPMQPLYARDEFDLLSQVRYGFSLKKQGPAQPEPQPISAERQALKKAEREKEKEKKKKGKGDKGEEKKVGGFEIKPPKGTRDYLPHQMAIRRKVIDSIVEVFKKHGGVEIDTPIFQLKEVLTGKYGEDSKLIYDLEDQGGEKCALRYDLTVPFARFMANNTNIQKIKRFHIGKVYRRDQPTITKGRFREFYQCDFDIAGKYDAMIPDAEVLVIMQEILETVGVNNFLVKVNHRKILEAMINEANCDPQLFKAICSSIDKLDKMSWAEVKEELVKVKGVSEEQADVIGELTKYRGEPAKLLEQLIEKQVFKKTGEAIKPIFEDMRKLFSYLSAMQSIGKVSFDLSLARGLDYYTGIIFEIVLTDKQSELGSISGGGRYDELIGMFSQYEIPSVGGSIGIERLFTILESQYADKVKENACEVLVATIKTIPVEEKLRILSKLWKSGIKAETMYVEKAKPEKQFDYAFSKQIELILWVGEEELKTGELNLKILYKKEQLKVSLENIGESIMPYVVQYREDYEQGKIPNQKKEQIPKK